ncbi:MAG: DNA-directed RNA polymerase subunit A'' [Candidatus Aenigmatarchaeota archaeon]
MSEELQKNYLDEIALPRKIVKEIEEVAKEKKLTKEQVKKLEEEVKKEYLKSMFEPGEAIGIIAAQSISEPATQMTMRTYHFAGSAGIKVTYGLPRLIEIFDAKKNPETPMMTIYLKKEFNNKDDAKKVAEKILEKNVSKLMKRASINLSEGFIEIEPIDLRKTESIGNAIKENFKDLKVLIKKDRIIAKPKKEIEVRELQRLREKILNTKVSGIKGISNVIVRKEGEDWIINTIGSNLEEVLKMKEVDCTRTITNDIYETARVLGIEAARNLIINEALKTLEEQGLNVDIRHLMLVGDIMTRSGTIKPIGRYGVAGAKSSILARAAFEETIKHLVKASVRNEIDNFQGIFENVMIGQVVPAGTGMFELVARFEEEEQ